MDSLRIRALIVLVVLLVVEVAAELPSEQTRFTAKQIEFFESKIRPLLTQHCYDCHSTDAVDVEAGLLVDSREAVIRGGDSGPAIVEGDPQKSLLIAAVNYEDSEMPPNRKLQPDQIEALARWVQMGAPWPEVTSSPGIPAATDTDWDHLNWETARNSHWAWQSVVRPAIPELDNERIANPIDCFVAARRQQAGLRPAPGALPNILARRIYIDLIGIPPTPEQVKKFADAVGKHRQRAVESLIDELLDSPRYGQRWSRHWLDVARYSDSGGGFLDKNDNRDAWRFRDWVVDAFNQDLPIDEFIHLQIAGDLTGNRSDAIATGFFALGPTYRSDGGDPDSVAQAKGETLDDRIDTLTRGLLGITGSCARCHDHKFDPIPQKDYYSLAGVFNNSTTHSLPLAPDDVVMRFKDHQKAVGDLDKQIREFGKKLKQQKREATEDEQKQLQQWITELAELKRSAPPQFDAAHALRESGSGDMKVAIRGNLRKTGDVAPRRFLRVIAGADPSRFTKGSGREELAQTIIDPANPLTARVFVNRVWLHHFGAGLVRTPSNFGALGEKPTHPQLLDWLTSEFVARGWSLKSLHRLIMTSATYQMSSNFDQRAMAIDGDNRLIWRMNPRRMDVEAWRDSLLAVTGELDDTPGGPGHEDITRSHRRTLYAKVSRNGDVFASDRFLRRFDFPLMRATVAQRPDSIVPQQFLFLLNSPFMIERAKALVSRLHAAHDSDDQRIRIAYQLLYSRLPDLQELKIGSEFIANTVDGKGLSGWARYAQTLLSANEFMYVR